MSLRDSVTKQAFVDAINDVNGTRIVPAQIEFSDVQSSASATRNSQVRGKATNISGNTVEGQADFNYNRVELSSLVGVLSTVLPARPLAKVSDALEEINRNCKLNLETSDIVDQQIDLKGDHGETFVLKCASDSPKYKGQLTFTLKSRSAYMLRGTVSVTKGTRYRVYGTTSSATFPDSAYAYLVINGVLHPIDEKGYFTVTVETGVWDFYYASPSLGTVGTSLPIVRVDRIVAYGSRTVSGSLFTYNSSLIEIGDDVFLGNTQPINAAMMFFQCRNLTTVGSGFANHAGGFSSLDRTFSQCTNLTEFGETENQVATHSTSTMQSLFDGCSKLTNIPLGLFKGMSNVAVATSAFNMVGYSTTDGCHIPDGLLDDMTGLQQVATMFSYVKASYWPSRLFKSHPAVSNALSVLAYSNIPKIEDGAFAGFSKNLTLTNACQGVKVDSVGKGILPTGATVFVSSMFSKAVIQSIDKNVFSGALLSDASSLFSDTSIVGDFPNLFAGQTKLTSLYNAFYNATFQLTDENADLFKDLTGVTNIGQLFYGAKFRNGYCPPGLFDTLVNVTNLVMCFRGASGVNNPLSIPAGIFANQGLVSDFSNVFVSTSNIEFKGSVLPKAKSAKVLYDMFGSCGASTFPEDLLEYADNVTSANRLFENTAATEFPEKIFQRMTKCTNIATMFYGARNLTTLPSGIFAPFGAVTSAREMFSNLKKQFIIPEGLFDPLVSVTDITYLFRYSLALTIPKGLFSKMASLSLAYSLFDRVELRGDITDMFHPEVYKNKPNVGGLFYSLTLSNLNIGQAKANIPLTGTISTMFGNSKLGDLTVDQFLLTIGATADNKIPLSDSTTNTNLFLLNATWLTGSKDALVKALWGVSDASQVNTTVVSNALNGAKNLT